MLFNYLNTANKSKRSQSALEYMMTYGWAILIIVIVAVILYSMGIFNPSSSVTFTSSGFSPFTVSSSLCNNLGYKIAIIAGPIPNNANYITINKVFVTSATGANTTTASYTLTNPVTLKSGQSTTIIIPNVACTAAKVHYSFSAKIQYSYTAGTLGLQYVNTSGTIAGTSISGKPSVLTTYEPITITNTQSSATPNPFQQMVNFTSADPGFSSIATGNFGQNVEFFYYNGTVIPSWLENYTSTNAIWWLKIAAIPAGSSETIYVGFAPSSVNLFDGVDVGEAPQLSSTYAKYDDGANVFDFYDNFNGTTLSSKWTVISSGYIINNGISFPANSNAQITTKASFSAPAIFEMFAKYTSVGSSSGNVLGVMFLASSDSSIPTYTIGWHAYQDYFTGGDWQLQSWPEFSPQPSLNTYYVWSIIWNNTLDGIEEYNYSHAEVPSPYTSISSVYLSLLEQNDGNSAFSVSWVRVRAYPPNGIMPSVTFGSVS